VNQDQGVCTLLAVVRSGRGDYTKERAQLLKGVTIDDIVEQVRSAQLDDQVKLQGIVFC